MDFTAVAAVQCKDEVETVPGDGTWDTALAQRASSGLSALITALRTPSTQTLPPNTACGGVGVVIPDFALVDVQGRIVRPSLPYDACGEPLTSALDAERALPWKTETRQRLSQDETQPEVATGCLGTYKDVFEFAAIASATPWAVTAEPTTACEFTVTSATAPGDPTNLGEFSHGLTLTAAQQTTIANALTKADSTAAKACSAKATKFVLLTLGNGATQATAVELDGCRRISYPDYFLAQAPSSLLTALRAAGFE